MNMWLDDGAMQFTLLQHNVLQFSACLAVLDMQASKATGVHQWQACCWAARNMRADQHKQRRCETSWQICIVQAEDTACRIPDDLIQAGRSKCNAEAQQGT